MLDYVNILVITDLNSTSYEEQFPICSFLQSGHNLSALVGVNETSHQRPSEVREGSWKAAFAGTSRIHSRLCNVFLLFSEQLNGCHLLVMYILKHKQHQDTFPYIRRFKSDSLRSVVYSYRKPYYKIFSGNASSPICKYQRVCSPFSSRGFIFCINLSFYILVNNTILIYSLNIFTCS